MYFSHLIDLLRSNKEARGGILVSGMLMIFVTGWMSLAYARLNPFLIILSFPMFSAIGVFVLSIILIRAENENWLKLKTIPAGVQKTLTPIILFALIFYYCVFMLFELIAVLFGDFLVAAMGDTLSPVEYVPDALTLIIFIICSISLSLCYGVFSAWMFSQSKIIPSINRNELAKLEGFVSQKFAIAVILLAVASLLVGLTIQIAVETSGTGEPFMTALIALISFAYTTILCAQLWRLALKSLE